MGLLKEGMEEGKEGLEAHEEVGQAHMARDMGAPSWRLVASPHASLAMRSASALPLPPACIPGSRDGDRPKGPAGGSLEELGLAL